MTDKGGRNKKSGSGMTERGFGMAGKKAEHYRKNANNDK